MLFGQLLGRLHLGLGDVMGIDAGDAQAGPVDAHHDGKRLAVRLVKDRLEHPDHEVLRGVVVVVQQHPPHPRALQLLLAARLGQRRFAWTVVLTHLPVPLPFDFIYSDALHSPRRASTGMAPVAASTAGRHGAGTRDRGISRAPSDARCAVDIWQSISSKPQRASCRDQGHERHLRRVGAAAEHRLAEEHPADRDAVEAADQLAVRPTPPPNARSRGRPGGV